MLTSRANPLHDPFDGGGGPARSCLRVCRMREILEYCIGGIRQNVPAGSLVVQEGGYRTSTLGQNARSFFEGLTGVEWTTTR